MNGEGKKHTLRFDPRTESLLLVLANIVAFTQHSVWVEITWVVFLLLLIVACGCQKSAGKLAIAFGICLALQYYVFPNGPKILASSFTIIVSYARKIFPCLIVGTMVLQKTPVRELMVALRKWHIPQGLIIPLSVTVRYFPALKEETGIYSRCHEAPQYSWNAKNRVPVSADNDFCNYNSRGTLCCRSYTGH